VKEEKKEKNLKLCKLITVFVCVKAPFLQCSRKAGTAFGPVAWRVGNSARTGDKSHCLLP
jgi:hypothetical protein